MGCAESTNYRPVLKKGEILGTKFNVPSYSNKGWGSEWNMLKEAESGFQRGDIYLGVKYSEVEYARRFLVINKACWFDDVNAARDIFNLKEAQDLTKKEGTIPFVQFKNGCQTPPQIGDLVVWQWTWKLFKGHVAVVLSVNTDKGYVELGEQNTNNKRWEADKNYSRRLILKKTDQGWEVTNKKFEKKKNSDGKNSNQVILGWVRIEREMKYNEDNTERGLIKKSVVPQTFNNEILSSKKQF